MYWFTVIILLAFVFIVSVWELFIILSRAIRYKQYLMPIRNILTQSATGIFLKKQGGAFIKGKWHGRDVVVSLESYETGSLLSIRPKWQVALMIKLCTDKFKHVQLRSIKWEKRFDDKYDVIIALNTDKYKFTVNNLTKESLQKVVPYGSIVKSWNDDAIQWLNLNSFNHIDINNNCASTYVDSLMLEVNKIFDCSDIVEGALTALERFIVYE